MSSTAWKYLIAVAVAGFLAYQLFTYGRKVEHQACELQQSSQAVSAAASAVGEANDNSARDDRRDQLRQGADDDHTDRVKELETDLIGLRDELGRVRAASRASVRAAQGASAQGQATEQGSQAAAALGDAFEACATRYSELAGVADSSVSAGLKCEAEHAADESLNVETPEAPDLDKGPSQ